MLDEETDGRTPRTKKERNETRKQQNKLWKLSGRKVGSGVDPNPRHSMYYRAQLPRELGEASDWVAFQASLCAPLPVTFRFGGHCPPLVAAALTRRLLSNEFRRGRYVEVNGQVITNQKHLVHAVPWCDAFQVAADSASLAKEEEDMRK